MKAISMTPGNLSSEKIAATIRNMIESGGERYWRARDFGEMPVFAVNQALSRLSRTGAIQRISKGVYYRSRQTAFGQSLPASDDAVRRWLGAAARPAGLTAANLLGFTTQNSVVGEYATSANNAPGAASAGVRVYTRRPESWKRLSDRDAALLDFLRSRGDKSELGDVETIQRLMMLLRVGDTFERLAAVATDEPPRVRAMLGALGQELGAPPELLSDLKGGLNPISRFDFGRLKALRYASEWQAK